MHDDDNKLSLDLVWQPSGHLTEIALTALGDGEAAILPDSALAHVAACEACSADLGHAAILSLRTGEALRELGEPAQRAAHAPLEPPVAPPLPSSAVAAALVLSALGAAPSFLSGAFNVLEMLTTLPRSCSIVLRTGRVIAESGALAGWMATLSWFSAALLVILGFSVARAMGHRLSLKGGV